MADYAHNETDKRIAELEKRLSEEYRQAYKETKDKLEKYLSDFKRKDEEKRQKVENGTLSEKEYKTWRRNQMLTGQRWADMVDTLAKDLNNVNVIAAQIVSGEMPEAFSLNANYSAYEIENGYRQNYGFTLYDRDTVDRLVSENPDLLPEPSVDIPADLRWNKQKIISNITQAVLQGKSIPEIAKSMAVVVGMNKASAVRNARTAMTGAQNAGRQQAYERAEAMGIKLQKEWIATLDSRTRHSHGMADGQKVDINGMFKVGGCKMRYPGDVANGTAEEVYNCFVGETKVASDSDVVRSYKHKYNGEIISIKTAGGVQFSCTPNHPILTPNGWIAAELLNNGDNILVTFGEQNVFGGVNPDVKHRFPRIDAIHKFGKKMRGQRACGLSVNFHGDISTADVEVVTHKRLLRNGRDSGGRNCINKFLFKLSDKTLSCFGSLFKHFRSVCKTSFCFIGCKCKSLPFFKCSVSHSCEHGFGTIANRDSVLTEYSINDLPADTVIDGELLDRLSSKVFIDTIVSVDASVLSTHVYNLQTENGYYFVNSIIPHGAEKSNGIFAIAKNCRCTMATVEPPEIMQGDGERMTYSEWLQTKKGGKQ